MTDNEKFISAISTLVATNCSMTILLLFGKEIDFTTAFACLFGCALGQFMLPIYKSNNETTST